MREIKEIIIHCAATPNGKEFHACDIDRWHRERGWRGIGYHYVICIDGQVEEGRSIDAVGAHCKGHNHNSIGICLIGTDKFTDRQWTLLKGLVKQLEMDHRGCLVKGHNEYNQHKTCPGFSVKDWLKRDKEPLSQQILKDL